MSLKDILFMRNTGAIIPDADIFDVVFAKKIRAAMEKLVTIVGNPLSFLSKKAQTAVSTKVTLKPVQDLHGYDNPWPAGGVKNQHNGEVYIANKYIGSNGNLNTSSNYNVYKLNGVSAGEYTLSVYDNTEELLNIVLCAQGFDDNDNQTFLNYTTHKSSKSRESITFTVPSGTSYVLYCFRITDYDVQVESGSSATSYVPYSNICPISGRSSVEIKGCGKNQFNSSNTEVGKSLNPSGEITDSANYQLTSILCKSNTAYTGSILSDSASIVGNISMRIAFYDENNNLLSFETTYYTAPLNERQSVSISPVEGAYYVYLSTRITTSGQQLEEGSTTTTYEPYSESNDVTITFPAIGKNMLNNDNIALYNISDTGNRYGVIYTMTGTYTLKAFSAPGSNQYVYAKIKHSDNTWGDTVSIVQARNIYTRTVTVNDGDTMYVYNASSGSTAEETANRFNARQVMVTYGTDEPTVYEPYTNTVYSGTLDVETGVLTVNKGMKTINEVIANRTTSYAHPVFYGSISDMNVSSSSNRFISDTFRYIGAYNSANAFANAAADNRLGRSSTSNKQVYIRCDDYTTVTELKQEYGNVMIVYDLATPTTIQLTPEQIQILKGENTIWIEDEGASIELTYKAPKSSQ